MDCVEISSAHIKKLNHPMKEIRERSLQLLMTKLQLGCGLEDELAGTRELLEALLAWFDVQRPTFQREALELLLKTLKTKAGTYIAKEVGIKTILLTLNKIKSKISLDATEVFEDLIETLRFLNTFDSEVNVQVPPLNLHSQLSSISNRSSSGYYDMGLNKGSSKETSIFNEHTEEDKNISSRNVQGINVLLFPWIELCSSDLKTMLLIEDSLKVLKSTRRCCRFIRNVFLRDFPPEIFLNRPAIVKILLSIIDGQYGGHPGEALCALLSLTKSLRISFLKLFSLELVSKTYKSSDDSGEAVDNINIELENFAGEQTVLPPDDALIALRQMPAPIYALDCMHAVLTVMIRSIVLETSDANEVMDMKELNISLSLIENLIELLLDCVSEHFWSVEHTTTIYRDVAHKACMIMRMLGELLVKYRSSFYKNPERTHHRIAWLRLIPCGETLLNWAKMSALPPSSLIAALQVVQVDTAIELLYPSLSKRIATVLLSAKSSVDKEHKSKYRELKKLYVSMDHAVQFMKTQDSGRVSKDMLICIKNALPVLHLNLNKNFLIDMATTLFKKSKDLDLDDDDWSTARSIALNLMAHNVEWVRVTFYSMLSDMVKSVLMNEGSEDEKSLALISDVGILTEICCHGLSSNQKEVECSASEIMLYLLRGRMVLGESCWWRLLASLLPVLPLLHVFAEHDTLLGKAICKSLEPDIVECMGVSRSEMIAGLVRLMFVKCAAVKLDAVHSLCRLLDDSRYLPPRESLRTDIIINALRRVEEKDFNVDQSRSPSKHIQTSGLIQILEVLKQDLVLDESTSEYIAGNLTQPGLEPSLRRSTLQQLAVMMRQQELHETFLQNDGLNLVVALLRLSLMVDDYLAFPECAISCVSVLNSICCISRHTLAKMSDLPLLLLRVILVFPANDNAVLMAAQVLSLVAWAGFALQELDVNRHRVPALPFSVTQRTTLPFKANSYWNTSPNTEHSSVEWLLSEDLWRNAIRVRWWWVCGGGTKLLRTSVSASPVSPPPSNELAALRTSYLQHSCSKYLLALENATSHAQVDEALVLLESYTHLIQVSPATTAKELVSLPWHHTNRFLNAPPASSRDTSLLVSLLQFIAAYMDNIPREEQNTMSWIKSSFIGNDATIISLLSRDCLYPQQTLQEDIEFTHLRIHIIKVLVRCIIFVEYQGGYSNNKMESLLKILLACLERIDMKNFHVLGYLNELIRCVRYVIHSRYCKLSEDTLIQSLKVLADILSGSASGAGRKGEACRLDAMLSLLALLRQTREEAVPVRRWSEVWNGSVVRTVVRCSTGDGTELRAAALHVMAALTYYTQLMPQLMQCVPNESLILHAIAIFSREGEANAVRTAAVSLLTSLTARSSHTQVLEHEVLQAMDENNFIEECLHIFIDFCNDLEYKNCIEPNVPLSVLERKSELEVRAQKSGEIPLPPLLQFQKPPPTASLIAALADVLHNVTAYKTAPVPAWNERGLYRVLFRCATWSRGSSLEVYEVRTSMCRALAAAASIKCVRTSLAATKDCLYNLLVTLKPIEEEEYIIERFLSQSQGLYLLAALLLERSASIVVWFELKRQSTLLDLLLYALESEHDDFQEAAMHCLTQLSRSISHKRNTEQTKEDSSADFFNNLKSTCSKRRADKFCSGDSTRTDCQPEYMVEDICKVLIDMYRHCMDNKKCLSSQDEKWTLVCTCLSSVLSFSARARMYCVHRHFPSTLLSSLQMIRDTLSVQGKPADVIRNADNEPILHTLNWVLILTTCLMHECKPAKERIAEDIATSLIRLWPWSMITEHLRDTVMRLLITFTNDCPRAWASMCSCVGGRSLLNEICSLVNKEAARPRPTSILQFSLRILGHCLPHHHCRTMIIKHDVLTCICKLRARGNGPCAAVASEEWLRLCEAMARHADGAAAVLAAAALPALKPTPARLLPALAHAAHHHRLTFLQSPDLLELLSGCLLTGDTAEIVSASRAVWALAANNHRAKLVLRSAGMPSAVQSTLQRLQKHSDNVSIQRAIELLTYTQTVLQTT